LYSLFFLAGGERNTTTIEGYEVCIRCYAINSKYGAKV
jgi:ribosomal protein L40E